jgi:hypothetical protein
LSRAVEEAAVFGDGEAGALAVGEEFDGGDGDRDALAAHAHLVGVDDAVVLDDVLIDHVEGIAAAIGAIALGKFAAAFAEFKNLGVVARAEPALLDLGIGPRRGRRGRDRQDICVR